MDIKQHKIDSLNCVQNVVSLDAIKLTPNPDIETIMPQKRNCYFSYEHPPNHKLEAHRSYSHVGVPTNGIDQINDLTCNFHRPLAYSSVTSSMH